MSGNPSWLERQQGWVFSLSFPSRNIFSTCLQLNIHKCYCADTPPSFDMQFHYGLEFTLISPDQQQNSSGEFRACFLDSSISTQISDMTTPDLEKGR